MGPAERRVCGWGGGVRTPATGARAPRPTTRRSPTNPPNARSAYHKTGSSADGALERARGPEARDLGGRDLDRLAGARGAAGAGGGPGGPEGSDPGKGD